MSKAAVRGNITVFTSEIAATKQKGLDYILGYVCFERDRHLY